MGKAKTGNNKPAPKSKSATVTTKRAEEARKKELVHGEGAGRLKVLESVHVTGVLASRVQARDVRIEQVAMSIHGRDLIQDTTLTLNHGRRYGLIGANGSGKTTLLAALAARELPIPDHIDIWHVNREAEPGEDSALKCVVDVAAKEHARIESLITKLIEEDPEGNSEILEALGEKLDKMDPSSFEPEAGALLHGLGFTEAMMAKATKDMSGGWRMRVALAQALFKQPTLLLLDEPTNHLDLGACVWLEEYLAKYPTTIVLTSHSEDFMNGVCTEIMQLTVDNKLVFWGGNYDSYIKTRTETEVNQLKAYEKEQSDIKHLEEFIRSCGTYSNLRKQADSKQKIIDKMKEKGLTEKPKSDPMFNFTFPDSEKLPPPVLAFDTMSFSYSGKKEDYLYHRVSFGIDLDSRVALVGPNGAGKSTLLKLMRGELQPVEGEVKRHNHLRIGSYNQHSAEVLPLEKNPLEFMMEKYDSGVTTTDGTQKLSMEQWRARLGKYGVTGDLQTRKMETMSDGQKARVVFTLISLTNPHLLLLDEPTNHLDMTCIDALADAIKKFEGGTVLVSHDFRLIDQVAKEIWVCDKGVTPWAGDIKAYKVHLSKAMKKQAKERADGLKGK
jgi:ATP-binding cassette subfamily F protein 2